MKTIVLAGCAVLALSCQGCFELTTSSFAGYQSGVEELDQTHYDGLQYSLERRLIPRENAIAECERLRAKTINPKIDCVFPE